MHYYPFHMGDYLKDAHHLSLIEDAIYRRILDVYYTTEKPLDSDPVKVARLIRASDHIDSVKTILTEFFSLHDDGWHNSKCDKEIEKYHRFEECGKKGAAKRWQKDSPPIAPLSKPYKPKDGPPIDSPIATNNQEPITNNHIVLASAENLPAVAKAPAKQNKGERLSKDWVLPKSWGMWAVDKGLSRESVLTESERFRNYWVAKSGRDATKLDWEATWRNWILKSLDNQGQKTYAEKAQDFKDKKAEKFYQPLLNADEETLKKWGLT